MRVSDSPHRTSFKHRQKQDCGGSGRAVTTELEAEAQSCHAGVTCSCRWRLANVEEVVLDQVCPPVTYQGWGWEVLGVSTQRAPLLGKSWVSYDPRVQGSVGAGVGATVVALQLWQVPRVYVDASLSEGIATFLFWDRKLTGSVKVPAPVCAWILSPQASSMWMGSPRA